MRTDDSSIFVVKFVKDNTQRSTAFFRFLRCSEKYIRYVYKHKRMYTREEARAEYELIVI